ncbi:hypothetical protein [Pseudomonas sp. MYb185]|uniref:hypothetical protein n=1 Tax=Pseudomonas sp. MYb185 TaxID=1848729 RepID=UPI000CFB346D|nr:hypothetical protein [Pseudomonas sp. MYb185]PRB78957.1 hypothetical protein CQ007_15765 [Pseudomonas sp. MYb185]
MSADDIEDDDLQEEEVDNSVVDEADEMEVDDEPAVKPRKKAAAAQDDALDGVSLEAKAREREMLARQMEEFLARGGKVQEVDNNALSDPPKKPEGKYGSRPI